MPRSPVDRPAQPDDPHEMMVDATPGDPDLMLVCLVEEYSRLGHDADEILALFTDPRFLATHGLSRLLSPDALRRRVQETLGRCGVLRVRTRVAPPESPFEHQEN